MWFALYFQAFNSNVILKFYLQLGSLNEIVYENF